MPSFEEGLIIMQRKLGHLLPVIILVVLPEVIHSQNTPPASAPASSVPLLAKVTGDHINVRSGPDKSFPRLTQLNRGAWVRVILRQGNMARVALENGGTGWLPEKYLRYEKLPSVATVTSSPTKPAIQPKPATTVSMPSLELVDAKPDPTGEAQARPTAMAGGAWRLLVYLVPVLVLVVLAVRGLKAFYQRTGDVLITRQGLLGGFNLLRARSVGGSNIRVLESVPVGTVGLHLVEVRGRLLLIGSTGASVTLLTEFRDTEPAEGADFRTLLNAEVAAMEGELTASEESLEGVMGSLDDSLRDVSEAVTRSATRLRRWNEGGRLDGNRF